MVFDGTKGDFVKNDKQLLIDMMEDEADNVRIKKRCLPAMNSINEDLRFTTEAPEDFPMNRLPTLDFVLWLVDRILFQFPHILREGNEEPVHSDAEVSLG